MGIIVHSQIPQPSDAQLHHVVEQIIAEKNLQGKIKVEDILTNRKFASVKKLATDKWRKLEAARLQQEEAEKEAAVKLLEDTLREELGCPVLSTEQIQANLGKVAENVKAPNILRSFVPAAVTDLREKLGKTLCGEAAEAFENETFALSFRWWLWYWQQTAMAEKRIPDISKEYRQAVDDRLRQVFPALFDAINEVIVAWGRDPKTDRVESHDKNAVRQKLEVKGGEFYWLTQPPAVETAEQKAEREVREAKAQADREAQEKFADELQGNLKARLMESNPELSDETADLMATKVSKKAIKKYGDSLPDIKVLFTEACNNRLKSTNTKPEMNEARPYGKAAGMTDEEFDTEVDRLIQERQADADDKARQVAAARAADPHFGEESAATRAKREADKKGKQKAKDKK